MLVKTLEDMESIVDTTSLEWDGWDVMKLTPKPTAMYDRNGVFVGDKWWTKKSYPLTEEGWDIPGGYHAQVADRR